MNLPIITFKENSIRIAYDANNEPLFCLVDVCKGMQFKNATVSRFKLNPKGVHELYTPTNGGMQKLKFINEGNLYRLILRSNKESALEFQSWVCDEVLPTIRKTGEYLPTARRIAHEEFNNLCMQEEKSKNKATFHSLGMHRRKHEKHLNAKRISAFKQYIQLNFNYEV